MTHLEIRRKGRTYSYSYTYTYLKTFLWRMAMRVTADWLGKGFNRIRPLEKGSGRILLSTYLATAPSGLARHALAFQPAWGPRNRILDQ